MNGQDNINIYTEIRDFFYFKLIRLREQEQLCKAIEDRIYLVLDKLTPNQLLNFFNSISYVKNQSEFDIGSLLKGRGPAGEERLLIPDNRDSRENVYRKFFDRLPPKAIQLLLNADEDKLRQQLGIDKDDLLEYKRIRFAEENEENFENEENNE
jgi:hypothetical protein